MTYNEYGQVLDAGLKPDQLVVFKYEDEGVATLEDGVYTLEKNLKDPAMAAKLARFLKASMKGWDYAVAHPDEGAAITLANDETGAQTEAHQKFMMGEIDKLVGTNPPITSMSRSNRARTVSISSWLSSGSRPVSMVITRTPGSSRRARSSITMPSTWHEVTIARRLPRNASRWRSSRRRSAPNRL